MMKAIAMFNNKGGVGKTTLVCNLASLLAVQFQMKILIIDADPQCNSSTYILSESDFINTYYENNAFTINDVLLPISRGEGFSSNVDIRNVPDFGLDILVGSPKLARMEDLLASDWNDVESGKARGTRTSLVFSQLISQFPAYDYIFFDMGPSLGAINRAILLACDYFITPMSPDIFSLLALENIGVSLKNWMEQFNSGVEKIRRNDKVAIDGLKDNFKIGFIGYVTQQYTSKTISGQRIPVKAYERIISDIPDCIQKNIVEMINQPFEVDYSLGQIPTFNSVIPMSQSAHKPIFSLSSKDGIVGSHFSKVALYKEILMGITQKTLNNLAELEGVKND